jgi:sigma-B regulation protein RsbU (phosphoserine phosphatase)
MSILMVDDEPDVELLIRQKFRRQIASGDLKFTFALNGEEALEKLELDPELDLIVTDINMPVMDGLTLLSHLARYSRPVRTVIVSAYDDMPNIRTAMNRGAFDFLTKPLDFSDLEATIAKTQRELEELRAGVKAREHLAFLHSELAIAMRIQQSILPETIEDNEFFEVSASMLPASQVSGDFYDFFLLDSYRLGICIGDVSGKGIPAALFMAVSRTLLRATALHGHAPSYCLKHVNDVLIKQSRGEMYVTLFYATLDLRTGELVYSTGGQTPPCVLSKQNGLQFLREPRGFMLGMLDEATFEEGSVRLNHGDVLMMYTDGVTEAENPHGQFYHEARLQTALQSLADESAEGLVQGVLSGVSGFTRGHPQSDDITVVALRYRDAS